MQKHLVSLFGSETRVKLLSFLFCNSGKSFSLTDLSKECGLDPGGAHRELSKLCEMGVVKIQGDNQPSYAVSESSPLHAGLKELFKTSGYFFFEEFPVAYPLYFCGYVNIYHANSFLKSIGIKSMLSSSLTVFEEGGAKYYSDRQSYSKVNSELFEKILAEPDFGLQNVKQVTLASNMLLRLCDEMEEKDYASASDLSLVKLLENYYSAYIRMHLTGWVQNVDMFGMPLTNHLLGLLKEKTTGTIIGPSDAFSKLTTPLEESFMQKEHEELLGILKEACSGNYLDYFKSLETRHLKEKLNGTQLGKKVSLHAKKYGWLGYAVIGPNWTEDYFLGILSSLVRQNADSGKLLRQSREKRSLLEKEQAMLVKELALSDYELKLFDVAKGFVYTKGLRKDAMYKFLSKLEHLLGEIARRKHAALNDFRFLYPHEFHLIFSKDFDLGRLRKRRQYGLWESIGRFEEDLYLEGEEGRKYFSRLPIEKEEEVESSEFIGTCACPGKARGKVRVINLPKDMEKMKQGDVMVSVSTTPDLVPAMKKASAIITDTGGITSHAAIVSRELNIPCVVGVRNATKYLKEGWLIDVDANHGVVRVIEKEKK